MGEAQKAETLFEWSPDAYLKFIWMYKYWRVGSYSVQLSG